MIKRPMLKISREQQLSLFNFPVLDDEQRSVQPAWRARVFNQPNPETIYLGQKSLRDHLRVAQIKAPFIMRKLLIEQDWSEMESLYCASGRPPYSPMAMLGLILYGIQQGITSLRKLEAFARTDLGCMWVSGGIAPDHSVIGKFIYRHRNQITDQFFKQVTSSVLAQTGGQGESVAGDGTVIEAACSHYHLLRQEAVKQALEAASQAAERSPDDPKALTRLVQANKTAERMAVRVSINPQEPEAMVQRQKRGRGSAPSYKPSVVVNDQRIILGQAVHPSSETAVLADMLDQSQSIRGETIKELLLDAGYCSHAVIEEALSRDISLLCPEGKPPEQNKSHYRKYPKSQFRYDEQQDHYICPAGEWLSLKSTYNGNDDEPSYRLYGTSDCADCTQREQCTTAKLGRRVKRYRQDGSKDALREVMNHKAAQKRFSSRQAWVEPVFSVLRGNQNLNRFRRKGLARVRTEFGLHVLAYNIGRLVAFYCVGLGCILSQLRALILIGEPLNDHGAFA